MEDLIKKRDFQRALMVDVAKANEVSICKWRYYANLRMQPYFWLLLLSAKDFFFSVETSDRWKCVGLRRLILYQYCEWPRKLHIIYILQTKSVTSPSFIFLFCTTRTTGSGWWGTRSAITLHFFLFLGLQMRTINGRTATPNAFLSWPDFYPYHLKNGYPAPCNILEIKFYEGSFK